MKRLTLVFSLILFLTQAVFMPEQSLAVSVEHTQDESAGVVLDSKGSRLVTLRQGHEERASQNKGSGGRGTHGSGVGDSDQHYRRSPEMRDSSL